MTPKLCVKNYHLEWLYLATQLQSNLPRSLRLIRLILTLTGHSALLDVIFAGYHRIMPLLDLRPFHEANFEAVPNNGRTDGALSKLLFSRDSSVAHAEPIRFGPHLDFPFLGNGQKLLQVLHDDPYTPPGRERI